jgi:hypothetical protein
MTRIKEHLEMLSIYEIMPSNVFIDMASKYCGVILESWLTKLNVLTYWSKNIVKLL